MSEKKSIKSKIRLWIASHLQIASIGGLLFILLLGYLFVFAPQLKKIRQANITQSLEQEREGKNQYLLTLNQLATRYSTIPSEKIESLKTMVPNEEDVPGILASLEASARTSDISISSINFSKGEPTGVVAGIDGLGVMNIDITLQHGSYERFKLFIEALESNLRLFDIRSLDLNPESAQYTLSIRAYVQSEPLI